MKKIKIANTEYQVESIQPSAANVLKITFADGVTIPNVWGDITTYTVGGIAAGTISGYTTVYHEDGQTIYLSNDGSVYTEMDDTSTGNEDAYEEYEPTLEELQASKKSAMSSACESTIYSGIDVALTDGTVEHFSLTTNDQINLIGKQAQIAAGVEQLEYHADGQPCRYYSAADMQLIITVAMAWITYHTSYCNALNMWIAGCETGEELNEIYYGADIPEEYQSEVLQTYLASDTE